MTEQLAPCPFCHAGETRIDEARHWTGMRSVVISACVQHWCARPEGQPQSFLQLRAKTREAAIDRWNRGATP